MLKPYNAQYHGQKGLARKRNIEWHFTYEQWIDWWGEDITRRGARKGCLVMGRIGDTGPYHPDNVKKITHSENCSEGQKGRPKPEGFSDKMRAQMLGRRNNPNGRKGKTEEVAV